MCVQNILYLYFLLLQKECDIDAISSNVRTALHVAVDQNHPSIVELLVGHGVDLSVVDENGETALHMAVHKTDVLDISDDSPELKKVYLSMKLCHFTMGDFPFIVCVCKF